MSHEERSESEHRSVLKGMTRAEALALVARMDPIDYPAIEPDEDRGFHGANAETVLSESPENITRLLAIAALGAEVVGAEERSEERFWCPECGNGVSVSEDGGCGSCGRDVEIRACRVLVLEGE